jgi:hypothetical protein
VVGPAGLKARLGKRLTPVNGCPQRLLWPMEPAVARLLGLMLVVGAMQSRRRREVTTLARQRRCRKRKSPSTCCRVRWCQSALPQLRSRRVGWLRRPVARSPAHDLEPTLLSFLAAHHRIAISGSLRSESRDCVTGRLDRRPHRAHARCHGPEGRSSRDQLFVLRVSGCHLMPDVTPAAAMTPTQQLRRGSESLTTYPRWALPVSQADGASGTSSAPRSSS